MKRTTLKLNPWPKSGKKPRSLGDKENIILCNKEKNILLDIIYHAGDIDWSRKDVTDFVVLS